MKTKILFLSISFFIAGILITSCADNAKKTSSEVKIDTEETTRQINQRDEDFRVETRRDWENFKAGADRELENRENEIKDLRAKIAKADQKKRAQLNKELDELERKNNELKERITSRSNNIKNDLSDLNEKVIEDHRAAQRKLKHDMDDVGKSIGDFFKRNTN